VTEAGAGYLFVLLFVFLPLCTGVVAAVTGRGGTVPLGLCAVLSLAGALRLLAGEEEVRLVLLGSYGVELLLDRVAATFIFANAAVCLAVALHLRHGSAPSLLVPVMTMLSGTANAVFLSYDLFNIFVTVDLSTILGFLLIRMGRKPRQIWSSIKYLFVNNLGMIFYLLGCLDVYRQTGTFSLSVLSGAPLSAVVLLMGGLVVKGGLFLPGLWLPEAHGEADAPVSALLSGVVVKIGLAPLLRIAGENEAARGLLLVLGPAAALWGVCHALFEKDAKRLLAYHTLSQVGFIAAVPSVGHLYAAAHGLFKSWLFLSVGRLSNRRIAALSRETVSRSLWIALVLGSLAISGCPPLAGFGAKLRVMGGALPWQEPLLLLAAVGTAASFAKFLFLPRKGAPCVSKDAAEKDLPPVSPAGGMTVPSRGAGFEDVWLGAALFGMGLFLGGFEAKEIVKAVLVLGGGWGMFALLRGCSLQFSRSLETMENLVGVLVLFLAVALLGVRTWFF
jgi:multicomponent Na+:H+ antiporter subunit D